MCIDRETVWLCENFYRHGLIAETGKPGLKGAIARCFAVHASFFV